MHLKTAMCFASLLGDVFPPFKRSWTPFWPALAPLGVLLAPSWPPKIAQKIVKSPKFAKKSQKNRCWTHHRLTLQLSGSTWPLFGALGALPGHISCHLGCLHGSPHTLWSTFSQAFLHSTCMHNPQQKSSTPSEPPPSQEFPR